MSTKIYNGYVLPKMSASEMIGLGRELQLKAAPIWEAYCIRSILDSAVEQFDRRTIAVARGRKTGIYLPESYKSLLELARSETYDELWLDNFKKQFVKASKDAKYLAVGDEKAPFYHAYSDFCDRIDTISSTRTRDPEVDPQFEIVFFPHGRRTLALLYTEQEIFRCLWESTPGVEDYHYQNQTDRPKSISAAAWRKRQKDWEKVLARGTPAKTGLSIVVNNEYDIPYSVASKLDSTLYPIKDFDSRVAKYAENQLISERARQLQVGPEEAGNGIGLYFEALKWSKTDEATLRRIEIRAEMAEILVRDLTYDHLKKG